MIIITGENYIELFIIKVPERINKTSLLIALNDLWADVFAFIIKNKSNLGTIFIYKLGSFEGVFVYKALCNYFERVKIQTIINHENKFINIVLKIDDIKIIWLDSYRIFGVELEKINWAF